MVQLQQTGVHQIESIHYLGAYPKDYARHRIIHDGLRELRVTVHETQDRSALPLRWLNLARKVHSIADGHQSSLVRPGIYFFQCLLRRAGSAGQWYRHLVSFAMASTMRRPVGASCSGSLRRYIHRINNMSAGAVLLDTIQDREYFVERLGLRRDKAFVVYVAPRHRSSGQSSRRLESPRSG